MTNRITFFEISGPDAGTLRRFYAEGLGLTLDEPVDGYTMVAPGGTDDADAIPGGIFDGSQGPGTYATFYVRVDDVETAVKQAVDAGATLLVAPFEHGPSLAAHVADPAGNRIGIYQVS